MKFNLLPKAKQKEIIEVLERFGLNEKEREIYFSLLDRGQSTITPLAKELNYPLTTVQSVLDRLDTKGLVNVSKKKTRHVYEVNDPSELKHILEQQLKEVGDIIPLLKKLKSSDSSQARIRIYSRERLADIFLAALQAKSKLVYEVVSARDIQDILGEKFHFTKRRLEKDVRLKSLRVEAREIKKYNKRVHERELREAKFLPVELTFRASIMFWDETVAIFSTRNEGMAVVIESASISKMVQQIFDLLWSVSRRMETLVE